MATPTNSSCSLEPYGTRLTGDLSNDTTMVSPNETLEDEKPISQDNDPRAPSTLPQQERSHQKIENVVQDDVARETTEKLHTTNKMEETHPNLTTESASIQQLTLMSGITIEEGGQEDGTSTVITRASFLSGEALSSNEYNRADWRDSRFDDIEYHCSKDRPTGSVHFGDDDFTVQGDVGDASWAEVCQSCCSHTPQEWMWIGVGVLAAGNFLYFFLFGLELMSYGAKVMGGCKAGELFGDDTNPVASLMIGILATVLLQSSSTTTSVIVSLVGNQSTGTGTIPVSQAIYMVMGANIGTSITNTIVAMGFAGDKEKLQRAFTGATVHDLFNFCSVAVMLPLEIVTHFLELLTSAITSKMSPKDDEHWEGPVKGIVAPLSRRLIIPNLDVTEAIATGNSTCSDFYPMSCQGKPTFKSCGGQFGLIACDKKLNFCPVFFSEDATEKDDKVSGGVVFFMAIFILFFCLAALVATLQHLLLGFSTRVVYKATDVNGYVAILVGAGITVLVQSSSITTSTLTPLVGIGAIRVQQMYPLTLGANLGTTITGFTAAMVSDTVESLQVALAHLFFNIFGILLFYPIPFMRSIPLYAAGQLGKATRLWRGFPLIYIIVMFVLMPLVFLGISALFQEGTKGYTVLGAFLVAIMSIALIWTFYWCQCQNGRESCATCMSERERKRVALDDLADNMDYVMETLSSLIEYTGMPDEDDEDDSYEENENEFPQDEYKRGALEMPKRDQEISFEKATR